MPKKSIGQIGCPICGAALEVREDKRGKYYAQCPDDGMQIFVRSVEGMARLKDQMQLFEEGAQLGAGESGPVPPGAVFRQLQRLEQLSTFKAKISESKMEKQDKELAAKIVSREISAIREQLRRD